tara:strand:- start:315 stop:1049 length:735 start_codon:yes stop_codon:yes gene_type:complete
VGPGFSERAFEFCFNHDYMQRNAAFLATYPNIPSQRQEKYLGYDVEFRLSLRTYSFSVFIQHKVSSYGGSRAGKNADFYNEYNAPYYRFPVDNEQHTRLQALSAGRGNTYYCAPKFHTREDLHDCFQTGAISQRVILLDPNAVMPVGGNRRHNITYDTAGTGARMHSEVNKFERIHNGDILEDSTLKRREIDAKELRKEADAILELSKDDPKANKILDIHKDAPKIVQAQILLGRFYGVTWLLI